VQTREHSESARAASEQARKTVEDARLEVERRVREARALISQQDMIAMQEELAGLVASFGVGEQLDVLPRARATGAAAGPRGAGDKGRRREVARHPPGDGANRRRGAAAGVQAPVGDGAG